jgi:glycosyltransferase involved in cell wall biosynthesis
MSPRAATPIVVVTSGFPRISETFALNELLALERAGAIEAIFATKPGDDRPRQPGADSLLRRVELLAPGPPESQAQQLARSVGRGRVRGVHAYFAHTPCAVAERAARALGIPYSFSVHAKDVRKVAPRELARRARRAACVIACNQDAAGVLRGMDVQPVLVPHGVDLRRFAPAPARAQRPRRGPLRLLAVGRCIEKKGFSTMIDAVSGLDIPFDLRIVGDGPLRPTLERSASALGLADRVRLDGPLTHCELPDAYAAADVVVVPSVEDANGDRDGLPNVVLEAMAAGRPVVASEIAAISTAVRDGQTGLLVAPGDAPALRAAIERVARDHALAQRMGRAARALVGREFELGACTDRLLACIEDAYA